jgi:hypothetical protein
MPDCALGGHPRDLTEPRPDSAQSAQRGVLHVSNEKIFCVFLRGGGSRCLPCMSRCCIGFYPDPGDALERDGAMNQNALA